MVLIPTEASFRALARSSPWRWTSLHFTRRTPGATVEAWVTRPDGVRVVDADGHPVEVKGPGQPTDGMATADWVPPSARFRTDGLVEERLGVYRWEIGRLSDGLIWNDYLWVAMLDPFELSYGTVVTDVHDDVVAGRPAWRARIKAVDGYDPLCSCCALLWSYQSAALEYEESRYGLEPKPDDSRYPDAYDVALDVQTGIVVRCLPTGGDEREPRLENDIVSAR